MVDILKIRKMKNKCRERAKEDESERNTNEGTTTALVQIISDTKKTRGFRIFFRI